MQPFYDITHSGRKRGVAGSNLHRHKRQPANRFYREHSARESQHTQNLLVLHTPNRVTHVNLASLANKAAAIVQNPIE